MEVGESIMMINKDGESTMKTIPLTKREWFAGMAMQGFITKNESWVITNMAKECVEHADALIKELENK